MRNGLFERRPWLLPAADVPGMPSGMLGRNEAALLYHLTKSYFGGHGDIIDAGAFLGCSSYCLAKGLEENDLIRRKPGRMHVYDLFQVWREPEGTIDDVATLLRNQFGVETADFESTLGVYMANLGGLARLVNVYPGDITKTNWSGRPIEILFLDICKTLDVWKHCMKTFYPSLIPGISLIIHQDWHHPWLPFLHVAQEALQDYFEMVEEKVNDSAVFLLTDRIPERVLADVASYSFSPEEEVRLLDRAICRAPHTSRFLKLAKAVVEARRGRRDEASKLVHDAVINHGEAVSPAERMYFENFASGVAEYVESPGFDAPDGFDEIAYLSSHPDIKDAVHNGVFTSGLHHWFRHGRWS